MMSKQVIWTPLRVRTFIREAYLSPEEQIVLEMHASGMYAGEIANRMPDGYAMTRERVYTIIDRLKAKYDAIQPHCTDILPPRTSGARETFKRSY